MGNRSLTLAALAAAAALAGCVQAPYDAYPAYGGGYDAGRYPSNGYGYGYGYYGYGYAPVYPAPAYRVYRYDTYPGYRDGYHGGYDHRDDRSYRDHRADTRDWREGDRDNYRRRPEYYQGDLGERQRRDNADRRQEARRDTADAARMRRDPGQLDATRRIPPQDPRAGIAERDSRRLARSTQQERQAQREAAAVRQRLLESQAEKREASEEAKRERKQAEREDLLIPQPGAGAQTYR